MAKTSQPTRAPSKALYLTDYAVPAISAYTRLDGIVA
jgi:hypothetical protein